MSDEQQFEIDENGKLVKKQEEDANFEEDLTFNG